MNKSKLFLIFIFNFLMIFNKINAETFQPIPNIKKVQTSGPLQPIVEIVPPVRGFQQIIPRPGFNILIQNGQLIYIEQHAHFIQRINER